MDFIQDYLIRKKTSQQSHDGRTLQTSILPVFRQKMLQVLAAAAGGIDGRSVVQGDA